MDDNGPKVAFLKTLDNSIYNRLDKVSEAKGINTNELMSYFAKHSTNTSKKPQYMYLTHRKIQPPRIPLFASTS